MSFKIIGDSCTDPVPGLKDAPEYAMVPLIIRIGNQEYVDNGMLTTEDLVARMAASAGRNRYGMPRAPVVYGCL